MLKDCNTWNCRDLVDNVAPVSEDVWCQNLLCFRRKFGELMRVGVFGFVCFFTLDLTQTSQSCVDEMSSSANFHYCLFARFNPLRLCLDLVYVRKKNPGRHRNSADEHAPVSNGPMAVVQES